MFSIFLAKSCQDQVDEKARLILIKMLLHTYAIIFWHYLQHVHNVFTLGLSHSNKAKCSWNLLKLRAAWWSCVSLKRSWLLKEPIKIKCYLKKKKKRRYTLEVVKMDDWDFRCEIWTIPRCNIYLYTHTQARFITLEVDAFIFFSPLFPLQPLFQRSPSLLSC